MGGKAKLVIHLELADGLTLCGIRNVPMTDDRDEVQCRTCMPHSAYERGRGRLRCLICDEPYRDHKRIELCGGRRV